VEQYLQTDSVMVELSKCQADQANKADLIQSTAAKSWQFIIAPHEIKKTHIEQLCRRLQDVSVVLYSELVETPTLSSSTPAKVLIIDNIGMLSALYQYARVAYVGGGFGRAIHNILEPIAFAIPVIFGPRHQGFYEAVTLNANGGARVVERASDLMKCFVELQHPANYRQAASQAGCYIESQAGATATIYQAIFDEETEGM
ncbi:MAG: 3-deoxy-D-manno-octulosonic acid transferase, partial [Bacteroidota bacterium]